MTNVFLRGWKAQLDAALRLAETVTEAAMRMHESQLRASTPEAPYNPWLGVLQQFSKPPEKTKK